MGKLDWYYNSKTGEKRDWYCEDVLSGNLTVKRIWEDDQVVAFEHPDPLSEIHVVVIPKQHVASILDPRALDGALLTSMVRAVQMVVREFRLEEKGFFVRTNAALPDVTPHMHWHVMGPGLPNVTVWNSQAPSRTGNQSSLD